LKLTVRDLNSRFSGITKEDLDNAVMDLPQVRAAVCSFIGPDTFIVGHGYVTYLYRQSLTTVSRTISAPSAFSTSVSSTRPSYVHEVFQSVC